jgi:hypothetical protein
MKTLIVGRYDQQTEAENAWREFLRAGFPAREMSLFYVNPQGQHALYPVGGDEDESAGTHEAKSGALRGAVGGAGAGTLVGAATIPVLGPAGPLMGAAVGAYTGALVGALKNMEEEAEAPPIPFPTAATPPAQSRERRASCWPLPSHRSPSATPQSISMARMRSRWKRRKAYCRTATGSTSTRSPRPG